VTVVWGQIFSFW